MSWAWRHILHPLHLVSSPLPPWEGDCIEHDETYRRGGTAAERLESDCKLILKMLAKGGSPVLCRATFMAISIGGHPWLPLPWRWCFGGRWPQCYERKCK